MKFFLLEKLKLLHFFIFYKILQLLKIIGLLIFLYKCFLISFKSEILNSKFEFEISVEIKF